MKDRERKRETEKGTKNKRPLLENMCQDVRKEYWITFDWQRNWYHDDLVDTNVPVK